MNTNPEGANVTARVPALTEHASGPAQAPKPAAVQRRGVTGTLAMPIAALQRALSRPSTRPQAKANETHLGAAYWLCADLLALVAQLGRGRLRPSEVTLRTHVDRLVRALRADASVHGIAPHDAEEMLYALVALLDELLVSSDWPGRVEWARSPLQLVYFRDNTAGENFFRRASALLSQPERRHVLLVYLHCLALGFRGRYREAGDADLAKVTAAIAHALNAPAAAREPISPHGEPKQSERSVVQRELPVLRASALVVVLAIFLYGGLRTALAVQVGHAVAHMQSFASGAR